MLGTEHLARMAAKAGVKRFIFIYSGDTTLNSDLIKMIACAMNKKAVLLGKLSNTMWFDDTAV